MKNLKGKKINFFEVLEEDGRLNGRIRWKCKCDCGNIVNVVSSKLINGTTKSCGCYKKTNFAKQATIHGHNRGGKRTLELRVWHKIKERCYNPHSPAYERYGGRGIVMSDEWLNDYTVFFNDMGTRPSKLHSIERIDNTKGYEKSNCRWATPAEQNRNKSNNIYVEYNGVKMVAADFAKLFNATLGSVSYYIKRGKSADEIADYFLSEKYKYLRNRKKGIFRKPLNKQK